MTPGSTGHTDCCTGGHYTDMCTTSITGREGGRGRGRGRGSGPGRAAVGAEGIIGGGAVGSGAEDRKTG
jgi:hypothetical protein